VEQVGTPDEIWSAPATVFVARFVGSPAMNLLPASSPLRPRTVSAQAVTDHLIGIRPDAVVLGAHGHAAAVTGVDVVGADAHVHLRVGDDDVVARVPSAQRPRPGENLRVSVSERDVHHFDARTGTRLPS
jgi:ABC-type sugar transport system ATPase subunit